MQPPAITDFDPNGNRPIVRGRYDAVFSKYLRVIFGGRLYVLDVDPQLTTEGNDWRLDLSGLSDPLVAGAYELVVEAESYDEEIKQAEMIAVLTDESRQSGSSSSRTRSSNTATDSEPETAANTPVDTPEDTDPEDIPRPMPPEEARAKVSFVPLVITIVASTALVALGAGLSWQKFKN